MHVLLPGLAPEKAGTPHGSLEDTDLQENRCNRIHSAHPSIKLDPGFREGGVVPEEACPARGWGGRLFESVETAGRASCVGRLNLGGACRTGPFG